MNLSTATRIGAACAFGLCLAGQASAQITKQASGYLFRMKYFKGEEMTYRVESSVTGAGSASGKPMKITLPMTMHVNSVSNGIASITATMGQASVNGQTIQQQQSQQVSMRVDAQGRPQGNGATGMQGITTQFPAGPVKIGGTWKAKADAGPMGQVSTLCKFLGIKTVAGKQMADVAVSLTGASSGSGNMLLLVSDGSVYRTTLRMKMAMKGASKRPGMNLGVSSNIVRIR